MADDTPVALVTGAAHGLGREVARQLAATGREVIITARDAAQAGRAAGELRPTVSALPVGLDVADPGSVTAAAQALTASPGRLDVLVNNAARSSTGPRRPPARTWTPRTRCSRPTCSAPGG